MSAENEIDVFTLEEHARVKGMWAGAMKRIEIPGLMGAYEEEVKEQKEQVAIDGDEGDTKSVSSEGAGVKMVTKMRHISNPHTPTVLKVFDELLVNASDHERGCRKNRAADRVTYIAATFDPRTGFFTCENDGPGINVQVNAKGTKMLQFGRDVYDPEVALSVFLSGSNLEKSLENVKGGINGVGAKLGMVHSRRARIETVDSSKRYYSQEFRDRLRERRAPVIIDFAARKQAAEGKHVPAESRKQHTRIEITPAYGVFGYKMMPRPKPKRAPGAAPEDPTGPETDPTLAEEDARDLDDWLRLRTHQIAAYVGSKVRVTYNGKRCSSMSAAGLARLYCTLFGDEAAAQTLIMSTTAKATEEPYSLHAWDIAVVILAPTVKKVTDAPHMTIVNGVVCNRGNHVTHYKKVLSDAIVAKVEAATKTKSKAPTKFRTSKVKSAPKAPTEKKIGVTDTMARVRIVSCGALPGSDWGGQRKDELMVPTAVLKNYSVPDAFLKKMAAVVADRILAAMSSKTAKRGAIEKYVRAKKSGGALSAQCALLAAEGDSALRLLKLGLSQNKNAKRPVGAPARYVVPSYEFCGTITLGGVVMNALKETSAMETTDGETLVVRSEKLRNNVKLKALVDAMHLDYGKTYATAAERATLPYGFLFGCVDQDLDGCGKILSLLLVFIYMFWPNLIKEGRIGRFLTPVIRMYPKKGSAKTHPVLEFHYEEEAREFMRSNPDWAEHYADPEYYKGLAAHEDDEVKRMFGPAKFNESLYIFTLDDAAERLFDIYFGGKKDGSANRKEALRTPVKYLTFEEAKRLHRSRLIPCSMHLEIDTKAFKLEAIHRQIPNVFDGLVPTRRKIADAALSVFGGKNKPMKVFQFGGRVACERYYHHGDKSLNDTMIRMAQSYRDARQYPLLTGIGQFGSRHMAGKDAGSARYVSVKRSELTRPLFGEKERWHLPFTLEEGNRSEPDYFIPDIPLAILECGGSRPSEGWAHKSFARDYAAVMKVVHALLASDPVLTALADRVNEEGPTEAIMADIAAVERKYPLPVSIRDYTGTIRNYRGSPHSFGDYWWEEATRTIHITELPLSIPTGGDEKVCAGFICDLVKPTKGGKENPRAAHIEELDDYSTDTEIDILIKLKAGSYEQIVEKYGDGFIDPIEDFLQLHESLKPQLNYVGKDGTVLEFGNSYLAALLYWFPARRALHKRVLQREAIILELRIEEQENILAYCAIYDELGLKHMDVAEASALLTEHKLAMFDSKLLHSPGFTPLEDLREAVTAGPKISHDYLLDLADRVKLPKQVADRRKNLEALRAELKEYEGWLAEAPFPGVTRWKENLVKIDKVIAEGIATAWKFKKPRGKDAGDAEDEADEAAVDEA